MPVRSSRTMPDVRGVCPCGVITVTCLKWGITIQATRVPEGKYTSRTLSVRSDEACRGEII